MTPEHYSGRIEPIDFITANNLNYCEGNIIKYVFRHPKKGGIDDLLKAADYLRLLVKNQYPDDYTSFCMTMQEVLKDGTTALYS